MIKKVLVRTLAVACALVLFDVPLRCNADSAIVENKSAKASIYVDQKSPSTVKLAARELQDHVKQMTGVMLPISSDAATLKGFVIYLGDTAFARTQGIKTEQLPSDGFRIIAKKHWMVIAGKDYGGPPKVGFNNPYRLHESYNSTLDISAFGDAGTLFGAYYFLERYCGVRWYMPGGLGTIVPKTNKVTVPAIDLRRAPAFSQRHAYYGFMDRSNDDTMWYRRAGFGSPAPVQVNHSFGFFFLKYKDTHPEYFALIDGKRDFTNLSTVTGDGNLNLSNPALIQRAIDDAIQYFDDNPEQQIFPLAPGDGMTRISEDPESQAQIDKSRGATGEFSNYVWGFINKVAIGVAKKYPDKMIGCIAYEKYALPPSNIERLNPNVAVVLTKFRAMYPDAKVKSDTEQRIKDWSKKASAIYTWEYYCNTVFNPGWKGYPMFFTRLLQDDLKFEKGLVKGEFIEAESWTPDQYGSAPEKIKINYPGLQHSLLYINAKLLWDPDLDLKQLMDEYYRLFYGPSEKPMREFWELVEANWMTKGWHSSPTDVYDAKTINQLLDYLKQAQGKSSTGSDYRKRIDLIHSEFSPATEIALRLGKLAKPSIDIAAVKLAPGANHDAPVLPSGSPLLQLLDRNYKVASPATNMRLGWDAQNLYVNMSCYESDMASVKTLATTRDSLRPPIWEDDAVELFLSPVALNPADPTQTVHLIVTANGSIYDSKISKAGAGEDDRWNSNAKVVVTKEATRWTARVAIPWKDIIASEPKAGQKLNANFYRSRYAGGHLEQSSWSPLMDGQYFKPEYFGNLTLQAEAPAMIDAPAPDLIVPATTSDYGSGASIQGFYYDGGIPGIGLFLGQPNILTRNDRAVFKFDLKPLLESSEQLQKVELSFAVSGISGDAPERTLNIQHAQQPVTSLGSESISMSTGMDDIGNVTVATDSIGQTRNKTINVTEWIKHDLAKGYTSSTFRFRDVQAERDGNPNSKVAGVTLAAQTHNLPALVIVRKP